MPCKNELRLFCQKIMKSRQGVQLPEILKGKIVSLSEFSFIQQICYGCFDLWLAKSNTKKDTYYYAKQVTRQTSKRDTMELFEQLSKIATLKHPFILPFVGVTEQPPYTGFTEAVGRNLRDMLEDAECDSILTGTKTTIIAMCIADAMQFMHKKGYDMPHLSTGSIFITDDITPRLSLIEHGCMELPAWTPPEVFHGKQRDEKSDVFLYGFLLFELLTGYIPFQDLSPQETERAICISKKRPQIPKTAPETLKLLIKHCWSPRKVNRPTFAEIYQLFELGTVAFPNSDIEAIRSFIKSTRHLHKKHNHASLHAFDLYNSVTSTRKRTQTETLSTISQLPPPPQPADVSFTHKSRFSTETESKVYSSTTNETISNIAYNADPPEEISIQETQEEEEEIIERKSSAKSKHYKSQNDKNKSVKSQNSRKSSDKSQNSAGKNNSDKSQNSIGKSQNKSGKNVNSPKISPKKEFSTPKSEEKSPKSQKKSKKQIIVEEESESSEVIEEEEEYEYEEEEPLYVEEEEEEEYERVMETDKLSLNVNSFGDYFAPEFKEAISVVDKIVHAGNVLEFMQKIPPLMKKMVPIDIKQSVFEALRKVLVTKEAFDALKEANVLPSLPTSQKEMQDACIDFLIFVFQYSVDFVTFEFLRSIPPLLRTASKRSLLFESILIQNLEKLPEAETICDQLVKNSQYFVESNALADYISTLFFLCQDDNFFDKHGDWCIEFFQKTLSEAQDVEACKRCYESLISFAPDDPAIDIDIVCEQLCHPLLEKHALSALIRMPNVMINKMTAKTLLDLAMKYEEASLYLMKRANEFQTAQAIVSDHTWLLNELPTFQHTVRLFMVIFKHNQLKTFIVTFAEVPHFFTSIVSNEDENVAKSIGPLFNQLPFSRSCLESFESAGFFDALFDRLDKTVDESAQIIYLRVMGRIAEFGFLNEFNKHIDTYKELMKGTIQVAKACFSTMNTLSMHNQCVKAFRDAGIDEMAEKYLRGKVDQRPLMTFVTRIYNGGYSGYP